MQCLHLPSAERRPKRKLRRPNASREIKGGFLLPLKLGLFSLVK